ncbi:prenyltransferase [Trichophyton equinum CBS 127.97]|uniref:Alkyl transferase n=1 Tax=Trichophyton equinum (strain ATCC MYA-4606 / CBS 127.97) TaxID=559882 RepID=F2PSM2_TRIEC|nr:prenyltransferase [Trichophyton equinum CBS 127.97]
MASSMHLSRIRKWLASSPPVEGAIYYLRELLIGALRQGPIPQHVAFVMDGNRRFARNQGIERVEGHNLGFEALAKILEVCYSSGIKVVTIYAFSIENFKRSKYEVDALMEMAKLKLLQLSEHGELLERYGASVRVLGRRDQIRPDVLEAVDRTVELTSGNGDAILNICFPDQLLFHSPETITTQTLSDHMLTAGCPPLDILIRTSGVERLSDFMLWQCHQDTQIVFLDTLWPAFSLWEFLPVIWDWQRRIRKTGPRRELEFDFPSAYNSDSERMHADSPWLTEDDDIKFKSL